MIPSSMHAAVVDIKLRICRAIDTARDGDQQVHEWMWELLFVVDGMMFSESSASVEGSRRSALSEQLAWIDEG
eukprot:3783016-Lingulodinium_polyedra.AAC.1